MSTGPAGFHVVATLRASDLAVAIRRVLDASRADPAVPALADWRDDDDGAHDAAEAPPGDRTGVGLTFASDAAFGTLDRSDDGAFRLVLQQPVEGLGEDAQRAALLGWAEALRSLLRAGALVGARLTRQAGGRCLPDVPLAGSAAHLVVCSVPEIERAFVDPEAFERAWDRVETHDGIRLCLRGLDAITNPAFLAHILPGQMALARAARPGLTRFYQPHFEPGERELLESGEPTLSGVGYDAGRQIYEFAGHIPGRVELRSIDLSLVWAIASSGEVPGGGPVREVRAVFMDEAQASRAAKLLQEAGAVVYWEDDRGELQRVPSEVREHGRMTKERRP